MASWFAPMMTKMVLESGYNVANVDGIFTSFVDGGHLYRGWITMLFERNFIAIVLIPVVIGLLNKFLLLIKN